MALTTPPSGGRREEAGLPPHLRGVVSRVLRTGLAVAVVFVALGGLGFLARGIGTGPADRSVGLAEPLLQGLRTLDPAAFVWIGVAVLLATPLLRVALSVGLFARAGDRAFAGMTLFVLLLLVATILVGALR